MWRSRKLLMLVVPALVVALLLSFGIASAKHKWSNYHWPTDNRTLEVVDDTNSSLYEVTAALAEWNSYSPAGVDAPIFNEVTGSTYDVRVSEGGTPAAHGWAWRRLRSASPPDISWPGR